jgi:hypothetical protein
LLSNASGSLKAIAKSSLIVMAGLLLAMPGTALIKQVFPQQPSTLAPAAGCPPQAS